MLDLDLSGRRAIVTGASIGIGAAAVRLLADHGATVAFCARGQEQVDALAAHSDAVTGHVTDMSDPTQIDAFLDAAGAADILVNNVGSSPSRNFLYMTEDDWQGLFRLNLLSATQCTRRCLPHMREQKWGRVIMVASGAALYPNPALIDYAASKAAMVATGKALAAKYGRDGVLVNSVLPGLIHTAMWDRAADEVAEATGGKREEVIAQNATSVPVGRYGTAEEVANMIVFLCTNAAAYVNGATISVDGGQGSHI